MKFKIKNKPIKEEERLEFELVLRSNGEICLKANDYSILTINTNGTFTRHRHIDKTGLKVDGEYRILES